MIFIVFLYAQKLIAFSGLSNCVNIQLAALSGAMDYFPE